MQTSGIQTRHSAMSLSYLDNIQQSQKKYAALLEPLCKQYDLTRNELDVILFLANNPLFDRAADIVAIRRIAKSHVSLSVGNLEKRNLLVREFEESDRRVAHLHLTEEALPIAEAGKALQQKFFSQIFSGLTRKELELWGAILEKICANIETLEV